MMMKKIMLIISALMVLLSAQMCSAMSMSCDFKEAGSIFWPIDDGFYKDGWSIKGFNVFSGDKFNCIARIQNP